MALELIETHGAFGGTQKVFSHRSAVIKSDMRFAIYMPPAAKEKSVPVLYWLSGLTCNEQNFITKAGSQRMAAQLGIAIVVPDTSPRGVDPKQETLPDNVGEGAGFYVDATMTPWQAHYQMYSYISKELPLLINNHFPVDKERCGIFGHSMGGHGALIIGLSNPDKYRSLSAFAPICAPTKTPWGRNALLNYIGTNEENWRAYDASQLIIDKPWPHGEILIDQGGDDPFLAEELKPELFKEACHEAQVPLQLRIQQGYDHSYYFVASFIEDHLLFHAKHLTGNRT
ncbi:MAG TPA: S-formylglutathione hydrolase [Legionella sp.]|nr:S-formylglutathione hydrolase [Legionella sp.]